MKLQELLRGVAVKSSTAADDLEIREVRYDSRAVQAGDLFVAIRGLQQTDINISARRSSRVQLRWCVKKHLQTYRQLWSKMPVRRWPKSRQTASAIRQTAW